MRLSLVRRLIITSTSVGNGTRVDLDSDLSVRPPSKKVF